MMRLRTALLGVALMLAPVAAQAQNNYPSVGGATVPTSVAMCLNSSGQAVPLFNAAGTWQCSGAAIPTTTTLSGTGANNADGVASVATGLMPDASYMFGYNGATWDRVRTDTTSGLWTQIKAALPAGSSIIGKFGIDQTTPGTTNLVAAGQNGTWTVQPGNTANTTPWLVSLWPSSSASAGISPSATQAAASNSVLKASAGIVRDLTVTIGATAGWVMLFDATSLPANGATGSSLKWCYPVNSDGTKGGIDKHWDPPLVMATGVTVGFSSTACNSITASATAFFYGQVQ